MSRLSTVEVPASRSPRKAPNPGLKLTNMVQTVSLVQATLPEDLGGSGPPSSDMSETYPSTTRHSNGRAGAPAALELFPAARELFPAARQQSRTNGITGHPSLTRRARPTRARHAQLEFLCKVSKLTRMTYLVSIQNPTTNPIDESSIQWMQDPYMWLASQPQ